MPHGFSPVGPRIQKYRDSDGSLLDIEVEGAELSFESLVNDYSGGTTLRSVLDEVLRVGAVKRVGRDKLRLIRPYYLVETASDDLQNLDVMGLSAGTLLDTIEQNIRPDQDDLFFQRVVIQADMPNQAIADVKAHVRARCQALANEIDTYLAQQARIHGEDPDQQNKIDKVGIGLYYFQQENENHDE